MTPGVEANVHGCEVDAPAVELGKRSGDLLLQQLVEGRAGNAVNLVVVRDQVVAVGMRKFTAVAWRGYA